jgi:quinoprotein glucose dehydrogenase
MSRTAHVALLAACLAPLPAAWVLSVPPDAKQPAYNPRVAPASDEPLRALKRIRVPAGLKVELWAAEPLLANPVCFAFDEKGRVYVAETFRLHAGVTDNRNNMYWLNDDLASRTVADRLAMYKKHLGKKLAGYGVAHDRVRLLEDTAGKGRADKSTVFADGFNRPEDGIGSGVLARGGKVWYACIPDLWLLKDTDGDGKADVKKSLHSGYGVHVSFIGHDLHGLRFGPDGKLYFSVGDRGLHVVTEGRTVSCPDAGAVLRCEPDGSQLEIVATGLRNPQELAFDQYGNLFTGDNNADSGDQARWVHVVEGGDSGWRIGYQYLRAPVALGPWNSERLWHLPAGEGSPGPFNKGEAAYVVPPLAHIAAGPSGLAYNPGVTLLPDRYRDHFFLCDFRGGSGGSGVHAFTLKPRGASFELVGREQFVWSVLVTDCDFGPDGGFYVLDWVEGWGLTGKGRIYKVLDPARAKDPKVAEVKRLLAEGMAKRPEDELARLLGHADQRVRQEAQFALAARQGGGKTLLRVAREGKDRLARLHALWGLGQRALKTDLPASAVEPFLKDADAEVRAQAARVLGWRRVVPAEGKSNAIHQAWARAGAALAPLLEDESPRVRFFAALALRHTNNPQTRTAVLNMLRANGDGDPYLRHAGVMAMTGCFDRDAVRSAGRDESPAVRLAALLTLRRWRSPEVAQFLNDADPRLVLEAARAINDVPIDAATSQLAGLLPRRGLADPVLWRALNANFRLGKAAGAEALARFAARSDAPAGLRVGALKMLDTWARPSGRDPVTGLWRPLQPRPAAEAAAALRPALGGILAGSEKVRAEGVRVAARLGIKEVGPALLELVLDKQQPPEVRVETLKALQALNDSRLRRATEAALKDADPRVRAQGRRIYAHMEPAQAVEMLAAVLRGGTTVERQAALDVLGGLKQPGVDRLLADWLDRLLRGDVPPEIRLDLLEAAGRRTAKAVKDGLARYEGARPKGDKLAAHREALFGGDAEAGRRVFFYKSEVSCLRCHRVHGEGGDVGPELAGIGAREKRDYLLEAIVDPNKQIAKGYETVVLTLASGQIKTGILKSEDAREVRLMTAEGALVTVPKGEIERRTRGPSAMPEDLTRHLTQRELRDLVEFLASLKAPPKR